VKDEKNIFDDSAAARGQKAIAKYRELLVGATDGWFMDYYPELNHKEGGYAMFVKFFNDGTVEVSCEIETNVPAKQTEKSEFDVIMEQGPILRFATYNKVMHYFSEPSAVDINGREGDYEFIVMQADADKIQLKGKKGGNKITLRRNVNNTNADAYLTETADFAERMSDFALFEFRIDNNAIGSTAVNNRTFDIEYNTSRDDEIISYAFTPTGIRLYEPLDINGTSIETFTWDAVKEEYVADQNASVVLKSYFPDDYQLRYEEFIGKWLLTYQPRTSAWQSVAVDTIEFVQVKRNETLKMKCDKIFDFGGLTVTFNLRQGTISIYIVNLGTYNDYTVRQCIWDSNAGYFSYALYPDYQIGLAGVWNNAERIITFEDNKVWGTYKGNAVLFYLFNSSNQTVDWYGGNANGITAIRNISIKKID
jgi:hypothetical protein